MAKKTPKKNVRLKQKPKFSKRLKLLFLFLALSSSAVGLFTLFSGSAYVPKLTLNDGEFTPLAPTRVFDETISADKTAKVTVLGKAGVPTSGVRAIVANITVASPTEPGYLSVYPGGLKRPNSSTINFNARSGAIANQIEVGVGSEGSISIYNLSGNPRVIVDISGYYSSANGPSGSRFVPVAPSRLFDQKIKENSVSPVKVTGISSIPASGVGAVVVNLTIDSPTASGYVTAYPTGSTLPEASSINFVAKSSAIANQITVKVGSGGSIDLYNRYGETRTIIDIIGYYSAEGNRFVSVSPSRLDDSKYSAGQTKEFKLFGKNGVPSSHVKAVTLNVTVADPTAAGYAVIYPANTGLPETSSINFGSGAGAIANQIVAKVSESGMIKVYNKYGTARIILDVSGYYVNNDQIELLSYDKSKVMPSSPNTNLKLIKNDVKYGPFASQTFDIYESATNANAALQNKSTLVWFFGGGWENGDNGLTTSYDVIAKHLAAEYGYKLVSVSYRKSGEAPYPAQYQDAITAVKYLKANATALDIDPNRIILGGFSAGGDIATMAGMGYNASELQPTLLPENVSSQSALVYRIVSFGTPFDKSAWAQNPLPNADPIAGLNKLVGKTGKYPNYADYDRLSALQYATSDDPPHYTVMSPNDEVIPYNTQLPAAKEIGKKTSLVFQNGGPSGHVSGLDTNIPALLEFLK